MMGLTIPPKRSATYNHSRLHDYCACAQKSHRPTSLTGEDVVAVDRPAGVRSNLTHSCPVVREGQVRCPVVREEFVRG